MKLDKYSIYILIIIAIVGTVALVNSISNSDLAGEAIKKVERASLEDQVLSRQSSLGEAFSIASTEISRTNINQMFSNDGDEYSLDIDYPIYGLTVSADIDLQGDASLVRIVLVDSNQNEYLIYEAYPRIADDSSFSIQDVCEETCVLDGITPSLLKFEIEEDSSIDITDVSFTDSREKLKVKSSSIPDERTRLKGLQDNFKIQKINNKELGWTAGETSVSRNSYAEKRNMFCGNRLPNLQGFEYYKEGIFMVETNKQKARGNIITGNTVFPGVGLYDDIESFDWQDRHGKNWITSVKDQGSCGSCSAFAAMGAVEAHINLHYNDHTLDKDLAEQDLICRLDEPCDCEMIATQLQNTIDIGVVEEHCSPYTASDSCEDRYTCVPSDSSLWKIEERGPNSNLGEWDYSVKERLIHFGPLSTGIPNWNHAMLLVGFEDMELGGIDLTILIFKNSWGSDWGNNGYVDLWYPYLDELDYGFCAVSFPKAPYFVPDPDLYQIECRDDDNDQFCFWGISEEMPDSCASLSCDDLKDWDDTDPNVGAYGFSGLPCNDPDIDYEEQGIFVQSTTIIDHNPYTDYCYDENGDGITFDLIEYSCTPDGLLDILHPDCDFGCEVGEGRCIESQCTDPDVDYAQDGRYTQSTVTIAGQSYIDSCYDQDGDGVTVDLREATCTDDGLLDFLNIDCDYACEVGEGRCIDVEGCDDPDANDLNGGIHTQSTTTIGTETANPIEIEDHCDVNEPNNLVEGICGGFGFDLIECEFGCSNGICLRNLAVETQGNAVEANQENIETCSFDSPLQCDYRRINPTNFIMTIENIGATSFTITRVNQYFMDAVAGQHADCPVLDNLNIALSPGEETDIIVPCEILENYIGLPVEMNIEIVGRGFIGQDNTIDGSIYGIVGN